jgi:hypothetical protein
VTLTERPLTRCVACPTDSRPFGPIRRFSPDSGCPVFTVRLGRMVPEGHILSVRDDLQMIRVPAGMDAAQVV